MSLAHEMFESGMSYQDIAEDFETENAKLRKLCEDLIGWVDYMQLGGEMSGHEYIKLADRVRELGMVV